MATVHIDFYAATTLKHCNSKSSRLLELKLQLTIPFVYLDKWNLINELTVGVLTDPVTYNIPLLLHKST